MASTSLDLPPIYLFETGLSLENLVRLERQLGPALVQDIKEARIILADTPQWRRAMNILNAHLTPKGVKTRRMFPRLEGGDEQVVAVPAVAADPPRPKKRRRIETNSAGREVINVDSSTESESEAILPRQPLTPGRSSPVMQTQDEAEAGHVYSVCRLLWYYDSLEAGHLLPTSDYLLYQGQEFDMSQKSLPIKLPPKKKAITISRAASPTTPPRDQTSSYPYKHRYRNSRTPNSQVKSRRPRLVPETTSDHEDAENMPPLPSYFAQDYSFRKYSCHRPTPLITPNDEFIAQLRIVVKERELTRDPADNAPGLSYAHAIASISAYPHTITSSLELARLPYCGEAVIGMFQQWREYGTCAEVERIEADERVKGIDMFNGIYDVGPKRARQFYDINGWRDLDDCVKNWSSLTPNQQVGVKYYDDFTKNKIPRAEVERIGTTILEYANKLRPGCQMVIAGGYRRGKPMSGDVDVILTNPDEEATLNFVDDLVYELHIAGWITFRLTQTERNSQRGQETLAWRAGPGSSGSGFDTLDKAFVVWHDATLLNTEIPNPKRRVDIIITPWKTAGCAIIGWSGQTMFERDLRLYCRKELGLKFDSSGIRSIADGKWQNFEADETDILAKEKKVFAGLGLEWREPTERCTG
jgi:DNA polymerase IV